MWLQRIDLPLGQSLKPPMHGVSPCMHKHKQGGATSQPAHMNHSCRTVT